jgi:SnoaL-like domain
MTPVTSEALIAVYERAWKTHDPAACAACFTAEATREWRTIPPSGDEELTHLCVTGRDAIRDDIAQFFRTVPDLVVELESASYGSDRRLWVEWTVAGTAVADRGAWHVGQFMEAVGVSIFVLTDDGFRSELIYGGLPPHPQQT